MRWQPSLELVEQHARALEEEASDAWWTWVRRAVANGVRLDVDPSSLLELPQFWPRMTPEPPGSSVAASGPVGRAETRQDHQNESQGPPESKDNPS